VATGSISNIEGMSVASPVNRSRAEACKVWDTGYRLTNMPSLLVNERDEPQFLLPVSGRSPWDCAFHFVCRKEGRWERTVVAETNNTWCGSLLQRDDDGVLRAYLVAGSDHGEINDYGGGDMEEWESTDGGSGWKFVRKLEPHENLLYNNPIPVEHAGGGTMKGAVVFFGWEGPGSLHRAARAVPPRPNTGKAFLWHRGSWK
jgi:hypothetical protein